VRHATCLVALLYVPAVQLSHVEAPLFADTLPTGQSTYHIDPFSDVYDPASTVTQPGCPAAGWYVPVPHSVQFGLPLPTLNDPAGQS